MISSPLGPRPTRPRSLRSSSRLRSDPTPLDRRPNRFKAITYWWHSRSAQNRLPRTGNSYNGRRSMARAWRGVGSVSCWIRGAAGSAVGILVGLYSLRTTRLTTPEPMLNSPTTRTLPGRLGAAGAARCSSPCSPDQGSWAMVLWLNSAVRRCRVRKWARLPDSTAAAVVHRAWL